MSIKKADLFAVRTPVIRSGKMPTDAGKMPGIIERLVDLQKAENILKNLEEGSSYTGKECLIAGHSNHTNQIWGNHGNHSDHEPWRGV